ncbi:MAG: CPBP family intramembrane metalloprotease [Christensenellaceae bacterium]|jgi:membrane protease YdiL (CAAX protease family)|nr:CPBP family intramembrane metalloprotease [Christensenellaceae bacterium]
MSNNNKKTKTPEYKVTETDAVLMLALWFPIVLILQTVLSSFELKKSQITIFNYIFSQLAFFLAIIIYFRKKTDAAFLSLPYKKTTDFSPYVMSLVIAVALLAQDLIFSYSFGWLLESWDLMPKISLPNSLMFQIIFACLLPAIFEEFIFRGFLFGALKKRGNLKAAILTSIIFALFHGNLAQLVHQFALSMILCYVVETTANLLFANIIHFANNLTVVLVAAYLPEVSKLDVASSANVISLLIICAIGIAVLYPAIFLLVKLGGADYDKRMIRNFFKKPTLNSEKNSAVVDKVPHTDQLKQNDVLNFLTKHSISIAIVFFLGLLLLNTFLSS